jgi:hypothetical protein
MVGLGLAFLVAASLRVDPGPPEPEPVVNGTDALVCEFPAAAAAVRTDGSTACTVAVVHPRVVLLAAHCLYSGELGAVVFGENVSAPATSIPLETCNAHPQYADVNDFNYFDLAYCTLTEDAPAVPFVPPLMGCEAEQLSPGALVTLPGYGMNDEVAQSGHGVKRWTVNTVESVDEKNNDLYLLGIDGSSVCFGDSGGPAYLQLDDGSWRVVGVTSEGHPDTSKQEYICGYGAIYDLVHLEMEWFETETGYDLTPCFDTDGTWSPDESCGSFPTSLTTAGLDWTTACATTELSEFSATCGDPYGTEAGSSSGGGESESGESSTGDDTTTTSTTGMSVEPDTTGDAESSTSSPFGAESSESSGPAPQDDDAGCGCRTHPRQAPFALLLLFTCRARRRRPSAARGSCTSPAGDRRRL